MLNIGCNPTEFQEPWRQGSAMPSTERVILVADDEVGSLQLLSGILTEHGYSVRPADSGRLALASATANPPALILLDMRMPEMDGIEVCKRLKANPKTRDVPVMFISVAADLEEQVEGLQSGAVDFIVKPFRKA